MDFVDKARRDLEKAIEAKEMHELVGELLGIAHGLEIDVTPVAHARPDRVRHFRDAIGIVKKKRPFALYGNQGAADVTEMVNQVQDMVQEFSVAEAKAILHALHHEQEPVIAYDAGQDKVGIPTKG